MIQTVKGAIIRASRSLLIIAGASILLLFPLTSIKVLASSYVNEFPIPISGGPVRITSGPDGALWFVEDGSNQIVRATTSGSFTTYPVPTPEASTQGITSGPDGALWFTEVQGNKIGRITTSGAISEYNLPTSQSFPVNITSGPDGALWFTEEAARIGRITTTGVISEYPIPTANGFAQDITSGPDGALWFTEEAASKIGRITTSGNVTEFAIPNNASNPTGITSGPDGALWFTENVANEIGRISTNGDFSEFSIPTSVGSGPLYITSGPDGALWFTEVSPAPNSTNIGQIGRITPSGDITMFDMPSSNPYPRGITSGPDNKLWFTEWFINKIANIDPTIALLPSAPTFTAPSPTQTPTLTWGSVSNATTYNIYRNGTKVDSTTNTTYMDSSAPEGANVYYVTAANSSGESSPSNSVDVLVDRTAPNVVGNPDSSPNSNGWYNHDATINWSSTDPNPSSGAPTQPAATLASLEGDHTYTSAQSCDPVANCSTGNLELRIDKTAPTITYTVTPAPNIAGWNSGDVTVSFTCSDALSGIDTCPAPITISAEGANQTVTGTATDKAGNTASVTASISLDRTPPTISSSLSQTPNVNGWFNGPVTVTYTCSDSLSGIDTCPGAQTESTDGSYSLSGAVTDVAGNSSNVTTQVQIDQTAPDITYTVSPDLNSNGWSTSNTVTVTFNCSDATSGIDTCTDPVTLTGDGAYVVTGTAVDKAGNTTSINALVGIDTTQPTITASVTPAPNANGWNNSGPVTVHFTCSDATSGITICPADQTESADGSYTLSGTAVDNAGNTATTNITVNLDQIAPTVMNLAWSANPLQQGQNTTLSATVSDNLSDPASVYYTVNGGTPQAMTYDTTTGTWQSLPFGANLTSNTYTIDVYAVDNAGNTSVAASDILTVTTPLSVSGHAKVLPTSGDSLPIALDTSVHNPTQFVVGFSSGNNGPNSIDAQYIVKNNKDEFDFSSTSVDWAVIPDASHASILVHGDMTTYVNGVETITQNVAMLVDVTLGTNGSADQITVTMWLPSHDPSTTTPDYQVSEYDTANSTITIK